MAVAGGFNVAEGDVIMETVARFRLFFRLATPYFGLDPAFPTSVEVDY